MNLSHVRVWIRAQWVVVARMCFRFCGVFYSSLLDLCLVEWGHRSTQNVMLKCKSVLWNHGCGICYHQVSGSRFGSLRARCAFHWSSVCRRMSSTDMSFFWEQLIADVIIDVRVDVSVSSVVGLCCNEWHFVYLSMSMWIMVLIIIFKGALYLCAYLYNIPVFMCIKCSH